jgi:hypothetical protein
MPTTRSRRTVPAGKPDSFDRADSAYINDSILRTNRQRISNREPFTAEHRAAYAAFAGITGKDAIDLHQAGVTWDDVGDYVRIGGLAIDEYSTMMEWGRAGLTPQALQQWLRAGVLASAARRFHLSDLTPREVRPYFANVDPQMAIHLTPEAILQAQQTGTPPEEMGVAVSCGIRPSEFPRLANWRIPLLGGTFLASAWGQSGTEFSPQQYQRKTQALTRVGSQREHRRVAFILLAVSDGVDVFTNRRAWINYPSCRQAPSAVILYGALAGMPWQEARTHIRGEEVSPELEFLGRMADGYSQERASLLLRCADAMLTTP